MKDLNKKMTNFLKNNKAGGGRGNDTEKSSNEHEETENLKPRF